MIVMEEEARSAVHTASVAAGAVALSPIPFSDALALVPIQTTMIVSIYNSYGERISKGVVEGIVKATTATTLGKSLAGSLVKLIPGIGTLAGAALNGGVAVAVTELIGNTLIDKFEDGDSVDEAELVDVINYALKNGLED